jgi:phage shock protein PspC (stress-responsive transcriptional regulator)
MNRVVTINLSGNAYQLDEDGYEVLRAYLHDARSRLAGNPDLEEIMADLEQAVADKVSRFLGPGKTVVSGPEVERVVEEMGPVDSPAHTNGEAHEHEAQTERATDERRRAGSRGSHKLYRLTGDDDKMVAGVCAGIAAYFGMDVSIVRLIFIALMFATSGIGVLGYLLLIPVIPEAKTPEEHAAAYGVPFDARGVIDQAKSRFAELEGGREWKKQWRAQQRYWRRHARSAGFDGIGSLLGFLVLFFGMFVGIYLLRELVRWIGSPMYLGGPFFHSPPWWVVLVMVFVGVTVLAWIMRGSGNAEGPSLGSLLAKTVQVLLVLFVIWFAYQTFPFVREVVNGTMIALYRLFT